jgi:hypothetical protein
MKKKSDGKKPKPKLERVWCEFSGRVDNIQTKEKLRFSKIHERKIIHRMIIPAQSYIRCPKCNRRLKLDHVVADYHSASALYLFSRVSKHKKYVKVYGKD